MLTRVTVLVVLSAAAAGAAAVQRDQAVERRDLMGKPFDAKVVRIADGDTLEAVPAGESRTVRIRLHGVDAPEVGEEFSREAQALLRALLLNRQVRVEGRDIDHYHRLVARVWAGADASVELLRAGLACHAYARDAALAREEAQARAGGRGFWAPAAKKPACVTETSISARNRASSRGPSGSNAQESGKAPSPVVAGYRGNVGSGLYHASTCPNAACRNCTRLFTTEAEARAAGFKPAGDCLK